MPSTSFQRWCVLLFFLLCGVAALWHLTLREPYDLRVEHARIPLEGWAAEARPVRVLLLADWHAGQWEADWVDRIVRTAQEQKPELILLLGDYRNAVTYRFSMSPQEIAQRLAPLKTTAPVFYVTGNHEFGSWAGQLHHAFEGVGFVNLEKKTYRLSFGEGQELDMRGVPYYGGSHRKYFPKNEPPGPPLLAVVHDPLDFLRLKIRTAAVVAGHTHGGQICYPDGTPVHKPDFGWTREMQRTGLRRAKAGQPLYVSRGLGSSILPMRMNCPPEISVLEFVGTAP